MKKIIEKITMNKKIFVIALTILVIGVGALIFALTRSNPTAVLNLTDEAVIDDLKITEASLVYENGITIYTSTITNSSTSDYSLKTISIYLYDESGESVAELTGYVGDKINATSSRIISSSIDVDVSSATKVSYKINK